MELKFTLRKVIDFEKQIGMSLLGWVQAVNKEPEKVTMSDLLLLFKIGGDYENDEKAIEAFDAWDLPLADKITAIATAIGAYCEKKKQ